MDDKKLPISDTPPDVSPVGDAGMPPAPPLPEDAPPLPPLSPEKVKTPTLPLPKDKEKVVPTDSSLPKPDVTVPPTTQSDSDAVVQKKSEVTPKENDPIIQPKTDTVIPAVQPDSIKKPEIETPIAPPEKEEMPVEAEFPGQPLPVEAQQNLEDKAKEMIDKDGGVKNRKVEVVGKPKGNVKKTLVGMLLFLLVGGGAFAGVKLMGNTTDNRSQAGSDNSLCYCGTKADVCEEYGISNVYCCEPGEANCHKNTGLPGCRRSTYDCSVNPRKSIWCCDGTSYYTTDPASAVCQGHGGVDDKNKSNDCGETPVSQCTCDNWNNACGVNCRFPTGTGAAAQQKANSTCKTIIAMCDYGTGKVSYEVFGENHKCRGEVSVCNNPVAEPDCKEDPKACNESCTKDSECGTGMSCDTTSNTCRNPICVDSVNCVCPEGDLICNDLTCSSGDLELGQAYTFTCNAQVTGNKRVEDIQLYEFQYQRNTDGWTDLPLAALDSNVSSELFIGNPGNYVVQCRVCEDKNDKTKCTPYQITTAN